MPTYKTPENFWNFLCSQGSFQYNICSEGSSAKIFTVTIIKFNNSGVTSPSSPQSSICISSLHLPALMLAILDYYFMSAHRKKIISVKRISGVKLSMGALWEFASLESETAPSSWHLPEKLPRFCISHSLTRFLSSLSISLSHIWPISQAEQMWFPRPLRPKHFSCIKLHKKLKGCVVVLGLC